MSSPANLLRAHGLRPKKSFGQNFLADQRAAETIAEAATTPPGGTVLELGAGLGALTRPLLDRAARVVAVERDRDLVPILQQELAEPIAAGHLTLLEADAARLDWLEALGDGPRPHVVAGNLPYLITGKLIERAVHLSSRLDGAVFMVQAEVAARLAASPGDEDYGALTVFTQAAFEVRRLLTAKPGSFYPPPSIHSAVVVLRPARRAEETDAFRELVKRAFAARRKTLRNAWSGVFGWDRARLDAEAERARISLDARGETIAVEDFARMAAGGET